ncbi:basic salivary proline-rich protein 4-like [Loxodonta africana]|uniref:basic salivary proline-rich protein 4-like n=1 Tax=Loxodonta africana TaxID=9785 RepID=UPI0030D51DCE
MRCGRLQGLVNPRLAGHSAGLLLTGCEDRRIPKSAGVYQVRPADVPPARAQEQPVSFRSDQPTPFSVARSPPPQPGLGEGPAPRRGSESAEGTREGPAQCRAPYDKKPGPPGTPRQ